MLFHFPPATIGINIVIIYIITQIYEGDQRKKVLVTVLVYGINMICDILAIFSLSDYIVGKEYNEVAVYITVFLISICEFIAEKFAMKNKKTEFAPPYWNILFFIPVISIIVSLVLIMCNLKNRIALVTVSAGILFINMLIFFLYHTLVNIYIKLEENAMFERQAACYSNQLDVLMQSEEKINALRHDMKHHLNELLIIANKSENCQQEIINYIKSMQMFIKNKKEYICCGNKEVDSILNYMLNKAQENLEKVEYKVSMPKNINIRSFDLNIIFGNLLDNAILAARNSEDKWLYVFVRYEKGMLFINIQNSYKGNIIKHGKDYITTKEEYGQHGLGLQNVKRIVCKYSGNIDILDTNDIFDVKIVLYTIVVKKTV